MGMVHGKFSEAERRRRMAAYLANAKQIIARDGWLVQGVFPATKDELGFAYTIGLTAKGLPELVVSGFFDEVARRLLDAAGTRHEKHEIAHGDVITDVVDTELRAINAPLAHLGFAYALYGPSVRAIQLVWADDNGFFPKLGFTPPGPQQGLLGNPWW